MTLSKQSLARVLILGCAVFGVYQRLLAEEVAFEHQEGALLISVNRQSVARYVYRDPAIPRPYFCDVSTPDGIQVTRHHPPVDGRDSTDHATMHPGIWLAFGDLSGADFWRNKARIVHDGFVAPPAAETNRGTFAVRNLYLPQQGGPALCREICRYTLLLQPIGYLLLWDSTFEAEGKPFYFGDQEEMGLGVRLATSIAVSSHQGGRILDSQGRCNESEIWGRQADWCDYAGTVAGHRVGVTVMPDPADFRRCWWHARDYGFMAANPFGRQAFTRGEPSRVVVEPGTPLRLRFGVLIHADPAEESDAEAKARLNRAYVEFKQVIRS